MSAAPGDVLIVEVHYDPAPGLPDPGGEWVLVQNRTSAAVQLSGWRLRDSKAETVLPPFDLPGGDTALIVASEALGAPGLPPVAQRIALPGRIGNGLRNDGDSLSLIESAGTVIDALSWGDDHSVFDPPVPLVAAGTSLRRMAAADTDSSADWMPSTVALPTTARAVEKMPMPTTAMLETHSPAAVAVAGVAAAGGNLVLSEVAPEDGWIELYNRGPSPVDVNGWSLTENGAATSVTVAKAQPVPVHGFIVVQAKRLQLDTVGSELVLRRTDGSTADLVELGPVGARLGWSRYPVHGGIWTPDTPLTPNAFNLLSEAERVQPPAGNSDDQATMRIEAAPSPSERSVTIMVLSTLAIIGAAVWAWVRRRPAS